MKKVLIAEDDVAFLNFMKHGLQPHAEVFDVVLAENGKIAKDILAKEHIDLLVTDIMMPEVDGLALLAFVNDRKLSIPCFVMSAYGTPEIKKLIPKDVLHFFSKPFSIEKLGSAILNAFDEGAPTGVISGITVASFLLLVEMEKKTCLFEITLQNGKKGLCYFNRGVLFNAAFEGLRGEEAALSLLQHEKAQFNFKSLPEHPLGQLIEKDLGTLIREARRQPPSQDVSNEDESTLEVAYDDVMDDEPIGVEESGKLSLNQKHVLELEGTFQVIGQESGGRMTVIDMCPTHLIFMLPEPKDIYPGDTLRLTFTLDDKPRSVVNKPAIVTEIKGRYNRCKFSKSTHYDRLGPYLHFNFLDKRSI